SSFSPLSTSLSQRAARTIQPGNAWPSVGTSVSGSCRSLPPNGNGRRTLLAQLTAVAGTMISPKAAQAAGENFGSHPVCSGPFRFVERVAQDRIVLEHFADYWDKDKIKLDRVIYLPTRTRPCASRTSNRAGSTWPKLLRPMSKPCAKTPVSSSPPVDRQFECPADPSILSERRLGALAIGDIYYDRLISPPGGARRSIRLSSMPSLSPGIN